MNDYFFPLAKYVSPAKFKTEMEQLGIHNYLYAIIDTQQVLKWGMGTGDRIPRQVEGMEGWTHKYYGWSAVQLRKELKENRLNIQRNNVTICVRDYTEEYNERLDSYGKQYADNFLSNRERDAILAENPRPLLNKQVSKKRLEKPSKVYDTNLFEFAT